MPNPSNPPLEPPTPAQRRVIVLGSTGSIGTQTLGVIEHLNALAPGDAPRLRVVGLAAGQGGAVVLEQARRLGVEHVALARAGARDGVAFHGPDAAERLVGEVECDMVVAAICGVAGLPATLAAVRLGRAVALANKETLVAAGALVVSEARRTGALLLPVDSEHCGIWQCLSPAPGEGRAPPFSCGPEVARVTVTASGGPFRAWTSDRIARASAREALNHPTWKMGAKVTIDSASLMNKALEVIEAHWLFGLEAARIGVLVHPQSVVHAMVEFADGSVVAQLGAPDMRTPIQVALTWPRRAAGAGQRLDLGALGRLDFEPVDTRRFPAVDLAYRVLEMGGTAGAVFNAANEEAVRAFLDGDRSSALPFGRIAEVTGACLSAIGAGPLRGLADVLEADRRAREYVRSHLGPAG